MYTVIIDELVFEKDFKRIDKSDQKRIVRTIRDKLATRPNEFGEPLSGIQVYVVIVGFRRNTEVYKKLISRLKLK